MLEHLKARGMNCSLYPFMGMDDEVACFPMYDLHSVMTGVYYYRPTGQKEAPNDPRVGKYFSRVSAGKLCLFGLESLSFSKPIYLTGGLFKAATLHRLGYTAFNASLASYKFLLPQLEALNRPFLAVGDNDDEGELFVERYGGWQSPLDIDEMCDEEVHLMVHDQTKKLLGIFP